MQLPRGKFHSLKKNVTVSSLLDELTGSDFTGHCNIVVEKRSSSLVFKNGKCMLAEFDMYKGREALEEIRGKGESEANAELYLLDGKQIELSLEFNKGSKVKERITELVPPASPVTSPTVIQEKTEILVDDHVPPIHLPRGKFQAIRKEITLSAIIDELKEERFSGYAAISIGAETATLIMEDGIFLLAEFYPERGSAALQVLQTSLDDIISAELYSLTAPQMQLALEFNRDYRVTVMTKSPVVLHVKPQKIGVRSHRRQEKVQERSEAAEKSVQKDEFEEQMQALESMDLDTMTDQFKVNFKGVLGKLELDYLIDHEDESAPEEDDENETS